MQVKDSLAECSRALAAAYEWRRRIAAFVAGQLSIGYLAEQNALIDDYDALHVTHILQARGLEAYCHGYRDNERNAARRCAPPIALKARAWIGPDTCMDSHETALTRAEWQTFYDAAAARPDPISVNCNVQTGFVLALSGAMRAHHVRYAAEIMRHSMSVCSCCSGPRYYVVFVNSVLVAVMPSRRLLRASARLICRARFDVAARQMEYALAAGRWQVAFVLSHMSPDEGSAAEIWMQEQAFAPSLSQRMRTFCLLAAAPVLRATLGRRLAI